MSKISSKDFRYTVSARGKPEEMPIFQFLGNDFTNLPLEQIDSVFGFVEKCSLYGGRQFLRPQISSQDVAALNQANIGVRIPYTNHLAEREEYEAYLPMFEHYYKPVNSVIVTNDDLAKWLRADFPDIIIEASVIKNIKNMKKLDEALKIYDTVVLPMTANKDRAFLKNISDKDRIRLFANAGCALTCPSKICYRSFSEMNKFKGGEFRCSQKLKIRQQWGMIDFDLDELGDMGFRHYKLLRARQGGLTGF